MSIGRFFTDSVNVAPFEGVNADGDVYGDAFDLLCAIQDMRQLVRNSTGEQVVSETTVFAALTWADTVPEQSRVTVNGRVTTVIKVKRHKRGPSRIWHAEFTLE